MCNSFEIRYKIELVEFVTKFFRKNILLSFKVAFWLIIAIVGVDYSF